MPRKPRLVYILPDYPLVTTTFVDREIIGLRRLGIEIDLVASRRPGSEVPLSTDQRSLQKNVLYLRPVSWHLVLASHVHFALFSPQRFFKALLYFVTRPHPSAKTRVMTILHFSRGIYAAYLLRQHDFDELHIHFAFGNAISGMVMARLLGKTYTMSIHAGQDLFENPVLLAEKLSEARHIVTCTAYNKHHLETIANLSGKVTYIPHGLDLKAYTPPSTRNMSSTRPEILSVGTLTERKGFVHLVRACHLLREKGYRFVCQIVGEGHQRQELEQLVRKLRLEDTVLLLGALSHEEVVEHYKTAIIFVLPSVQSSSGDLDGIPNVIAEAMAMELPIVSSDISGVPELVENQVSGLLTPAGDETALANAMAQLLDDPELRVMMGQTGRSTVCEKFDVDRNTDILATTLWEERIPELQGPATSSK